MFQWVLVWACKLCRQDDLTPTVSDPQRISSGSPPCRVNDPHEHVAQPTHVKELLSLAKLLGDRYKQGAEARDIEKAIALDREALAICTPGHPQRAYCLSQLSYHFWQQYERFGGMEKIEESISLEREALDLRPAGNKAHSTSLYRLALHLCTRYQQLGQAEDLSEAIDLNKKALLCHPQGHPGRSHILCNLALCLTCRYTQLGCADDLNEAIEFAREDLELCPPGHPDRPASLNNVANNLSDRYRLLGRPQDLSDAIDLHREALKLCLPGNRLRSSFLNNLASCHLDRYRKLGAVEDLGLAINLYREALMLCPAGDPSQSLSINNLANCLSERHQQLGAWEDLREAIILYKGVLRFHPPGHPLRSQSLNYLAGCLSNRYQQLGHREADKEELFSVYNELTCKVLSVSPADLSAVRAWIRAAEEFHHPSTILAYQTALQLLSQYLATLPSLPQHPAILRKQSASLATDAFLACLRNQSPASAVETLEQGRALYWSQLARLRSPLEDVVASSPEGRTLADEYAQLASLVQDALNSTDGDQHDCVCQLNVKLARTVSKIRTLPGLSRFLLPLLFPDLQHAARDGPVVIVNATQHSCDALVVSVSRDPIHVPLLATRTGIRMLVSNLSKLTERAKKDEVKNDLQAFLRDLWDSVVSPITDRLCSELACPRGSRVWWCPTAEFSLLPLHAAAPYRKGQKGFSDLYISSYTHTLNNLLRARQFTPSISGPRPKRFVAVGQANANGTNILESVSTELANISRELHGLTMFTSIEGQDSSISRVTEELKRNEWVHIACHGFPDKNNPFESAFALGDGHLTIKHISQLDPKDAEFAYLSTCHTTVGDEESPDEALHLAAAMQFAGFRSVIGTTWEVDDAQANKIASAFYKHMVDDAGRLDHTRAAHALWKTTRSVKVPLDQRILYVHIGA